MQKSEMGGAGSSQTQNLSAAGAKSIKILTDTQNVGAKYSVFDFESSLDELAVIILIISLLLALTLVIYIKRRLNKRKLQHSEELRRLKCVKSKVEEKPSQGNEMAVYNPDWSDRQLEHTKSISEFSTRLELMEHRVFGGEI